MQARRGGTGLSSAAGGSAVACPLCGADDPRVRFEATANGESAAEDVQRFRCTHPGYGRHHRIVECRRCGLAYASPRPDAAAILAGYAAVEDPLYLAEEEGRVLTFERHLRSLARYRRPPGRLLDVGAFTGVFVEAARRAGWAAVGLEPSTWAVEVARRRGTPMIAGTFADARPEDASFDAVTLWDVIEHVPDPLGELRHAAAVLKPGGLLVVHTMDCDSLFARLMGRRWPWLMEMHIVYFSKRTLRAMAEKAGFRVLDVAAQGRYLRLGYLATRVGALAGAAVGRAAGGLVAAARLQATAVPLNVGDLVTLFAVRA